MKILSILLNIALISIAIFLITEKGVRKIEPFEFLIFILLFLTPIINLIYILIWGGNTWLSLYFKRKAIEEQIKIKELSEKEK